MLAYYNENDPKAAAWLRELIKVGAIAPGTVDERSIEDVTPNDLRDFTQHHFFAGIGGWSYALRLAGWDDNRPVWTGSCPCQPFSDAGQKGGTSDRRHLWPHFFRLIREYRPATVFGEQVASKDGLAWLDIVSADLESEGYAVGAVDLCAAGVESPHQRQRLWFVADSNGPDASAERQQHGRQLRQQPQDGSALRMADHDSTGRSLERSAELLDGERKTFGNDVDGRCEARELANSGREGFQEQQCYQGVSSEACARDSREDSERGGSLVNAAGEQMGISRRPWFPRGPDSADWIECTDGKWRPVEPGTFPLAHGVPSRLGRLRGYGNAIVPQVAAEFIAAYCGH